MKKNLRTFGTIALAIVVTAVATIFSSCTSRLLHDKQTRKTVEAAFKARAEWLPEMPKADQTGRRLSKWELQALEFLYAYMPVSDVADYDVSLFVANVSTSLTASREMPWGDSVPEDLFLHFVLPVRVNNENLDRSRIDFYNELKPRVEGLSMADAILEVNHWCHEKVVYTPSDGRTSAPGATVRSAYGRCGEESTFTVAALRSVGIPARQVYTPRWAHTDNNHAWVEAWADGQWYYLGACEPEPVLDMGWFDAPAKRSMLMHTKVFGGGYRGPEEVIDANPLYTEINVTSNYAPTAKVDVAVVNADGTPVPNADVAFGIYNYAEFYPAVRKTADAEGRTSLSAGLGDMVIWASDGKNYGFEKVSFGKQAEVNITLHSPDAPAYPVLDLDIVPPAAAPAEQRVTPEQRKANDLRLAQEDSIRNAYVATFMDQAQANALAGKIGADSALVWKYIEGSRGNWAEISAFLEAAASMGGENLATALDLLDVVSPKDLRDTPADVLLDHLKGAMPYRDCPYFKEYILNPRVDTELITPYRSFFAQGKAASDCSAASDPAAGAAAKITPTDIIAACDALPMVDSLNPARIPISPLGVARLKMGDQASRVRYFIAMSRSNGIPARVETISRRLQYFDNAKDEWVNVQFADQTAEVIPPKGTLTLNYKPTDKNANPAYETHFTLSKITGGRPRVIALNRYDVDMGGGNSFNALFARPLELEAGDYMLITGTRMASGAVLSQVRFFTVAEGQNTTVGMTMREDERDVQVIGEMNPEALFLPQGKTEPQSILATVGRGYFVVILAEPNKEPTNHVLRDIAALQDQFDQWGRGIVVLFQSEEQIAKFNAAEFGPLPSTITYGVDQGGEITKAFARDLKVSPTNLPVVVIADTFGRVVFVSQGYTIGMGEQLMQVIKAIK